MAHPRSPRHRHRYGCGAEPKGVCGGEEGCREGGRASVSGLWGVGDLSGGDGGEGGGVGGGGGDVRGWDGMGG